jgi:hypothetical protein
VDHYVGPDRVEEVQERFPVDLYLCRSCGHAQLLDVINPEFLFREYLYTTSCSLGLAEHFRKYAEQALRRLAPVAGSLVVDIGSNDGSLLRFFQEAGMTVLGIDPACDIARAATASGIETIAEFFTSDLARRLRRQRGPASIVTANNAFAHSDELGDMADGVREILAIDGVFIFEVAYLADLIDKPLFDTIFHEHLCYHSVKPLKHFLERHGMELVSVERIPTKGGSLRSMAQLAGGPRAISSSVSEFLEEESKSRLDRPEVFGVLVDKLEQTRSQVLELVDGIRAGGGTVAGYGASATVTALMHYLDVGTRLAFIVDDNPRKHNRFSPGHHVPVLPSSELYQRKPDYVLVLAWVYAEPILRKHQVFLDQGGRFIIPLPTLRVI